MQIKVVNKFELCHFVNFKGLYIKLYINGNVGRKTLCRNLFEWNISIKTKKYQINNEFLFDERAISLQEKINEYIKLIMKFALCLRYNRMLQFHV